MNPGQKFIVTHRENRGSIQSVRRAREVRHMDFPWNAIAAALNDIETVRLIRAYLEQAKKQAA